MTQKRILIVGCGSIGLRHIRALRSIGVQTIAALRSGKGHNNEDPIFDDITIFHDKNSAYQWHATHMIISTPTSMHLESVVDAVKLGIPYFVEKPICADVGELERMNQDSLNLGIVGYNLRYHELFVELKHIIDSGKYGKILAASLFVGSYLPFWHPEQDYSSRYEARKDLGGGVLRTLSHEIDLAQHLFGNITKVYAKILKMSQLKIDVEDHVDIIAENENNVHIKIQQDYLQPILRRGGEILFDSGMLCYDFSGNSISYTSYDKKVEEAIFQGYDYFDKQYQVQMEQFVNGARGVACTVMEEKQNMKVIKYCELSSQKGIELCLD